MARSTTDLPLTRDELERELEEVISDPDRLEAVRRTLRAGPSSDEALDRLTRLASHILDAPVALVSVIDDERHHFRSDVGLPEPEASTGGRPLAEAFCHYTVALGHPLVIEDASAHPLVRDNPATEEFHIRGYLGMPLVTSDGHGIGNFCVIDTEPRRWSDDQVQALEDLAASVITEIEARVYAREAEEAVRTREEVLAVVSHDLRSPLQSILMGAKMLDEPELSEEARRSQVQAIQRSARRMDRLVGDLLDIAKMEEQGFSLDRREVDPDRVAEEALDAFRGDASEKGLELDARVHDESPAIHADEHQLLRVLENLLGNAVKFTPPGGRISLSVEPDGTDVRFAVRDTGPGIPEEDRDGLFDPFARGRDGEKSGTGLGLPIAGGIVEAHGGEIAVETAEGEGTTFRFTIPAAGGV